MKAKKIKQPVGFIQTQQLRTTKLMQRGDADVNATTEKRKVQDNSGAYLWATTE